MNRKGERVQRGQKRWCSGGGGKIFVAGGKAGLTGQQQRLLVLPGFLLKTRTPPHTPPPTHTHPRTTLLHVLHPSITTTLCFTFLSPPFVPSLPSPSTSFCLLSFSSSTSLTSSSPPPLPPPSRLGHYRHSTAGLRDGGEAAVGVGWGDGGGQKGLRCSGSMRVAGFEKKLDGFLMQPVDGQTVGDRRSGLLSFIHLL